jgi:hypothetical protein
MRTGHRLHRRRRLHQLSRFTDISMTSFHPARNGVAPLTEKTAPASPAVVFLFAGKSRASMTNKKEMSAV